MHPRTALYVYFLTLTLIPSMATYDEAIRSKSVVLVEFYATWCPHCRAMAPVMDEISEILGDSAYVLQLDVDKNQDAANAESVEATPTFILYHDGRKVWRHEGEIDGNTLLAKVQSVL